MTVFPSWAEEKGEDDDTGAILKVRQALGIFYFANDPVSAKFFQGPSLFDGSVSYWMFATCSLDTPVCGRR